MKTFENKQARFDFHILETKEVGVMLKGWEIKAIRSGHLSLTGGWVRCVQGRWLWFGEITPLEQASTHVKPEPWTTRALLMKKEESQKWLGKVVERGMTVVPLRGYFVNGRFKMEIALAKGKKEFDKRASAKSSDADREAQKAMKKAAKAPV